VPESVVVTGPPSDPFGHVTCFKHKFVHGFVPVSEELSTPQNGPVHPSPLLVSVSVVSPPPPLSLSPPSKVELSSLPHAVNVAVATPPNANASHATVRINPPTTA
jgi:hypothetical protein